MKKKYIWLINHHEYTTFIVGITVYLCLALGKLLFNWETFGIEYVQKLAWGIINVSVIGAVCWIWMKFFPFRDRIDPDTSDRDLTELTPWQKQIIRIAESFIAFCFYALMFWGAIFSASQL